MGRNFNSPFLDISANKPIKVFLFQAIAFLALIPQVMFASKEQWLISVAVYYILVLFGGTITFHRLLSHRSFKPKLWFKYSGPLIGSLIGAGSPIGWVSNHRQHHQFADTERDPHSPQFIPWYKVQWFSMFCKPRVRVVVDLLRSPFHVTLHKYYWGLHLIYGLLLLAIDPFAVIYFYLVPATLAWNSASLVNLLNHYNWFGYRSFDTPDCSRNSFITALLVGGEGYHNNHHAFPKRYSFQNKWFEFDPGGFMIKYFLSESISPISAK